MKNQFIPYDLALALKELGFDEKCLTYYFEDGTFSDAIEEDETAYPGDIRFLNHQNSYGENVSAPLYQQAFRWFREEYNLWVEISKPHSWLLTVSDKEQNKRMSLEDYDGYIEPLSYEEAELACLKKLIKIVKTNK
jgi:hypothetical protein